MSRREVQEEWSRRIQPASRGHARGGGNIDDGKHVVNMVLVAVLVSQLRGWWW